MSWQFSVLIFQFDALARLVPEAMVYQLGWTLVHFVWQGTLIAVLVGLAVAALRRCSANSRYVAGCLGLLAMAVAAGATLFIVGNPEDRAARAAWQQALDVVGAPPYPTEGTIRDAGALPIAGLTDSENTPPKPRLAKGGKDGGQDARPPEAAGSGEWGRVVIAKLEAYLPWFVGAWLAGMSALSVRLLGGWVQVQRMRRRLVKQASEQLRTVTADLARRLRVNRPVRLLISAAAEAPVAIGWLRPVILLPVGAITGLTPEQLRAVLAHELAHIRRYDYLVNILQSVVETLLFYHPAVWWVSRRIRIEREHCCDDMAVAVSDNVLSYARALERMEMLRAKPVRLAVAATSGSLLARIHRLIVPTVSQPSRWPAWMAAAIPMALVFGLIVSAGLTASPATAPGGNDPFPVDPAKITRSAPNLSKPAKTPATQPSANTSLASQGASSTAVSGTVLSPSGEPAAGAEVVMVAPKHEARFNGTRYAGQIHVSTGKALEGMSVRTDAQGRFEFPEECDGYALVAVHEQGCVEVYRPPGVDTYELRLQQWARVEGTLYRGRAAAPRHALGVTCPRAYNARGRDENPWNDDGASIRFRQKLQTDEAGRFVIEKAPPGTCAIRPEMTYGIMGGDLEVELKAGETRRVSTGAGRTVKGRLVAERGSGLVLTPANTRLSVNLYPPSISGSVDEIESVLQAYQAFLRSPEGAPYARHSVPVGEDGSFEIPDLPPGIYLLQARVLHPTDVWLGDQVHATVGWRSDKFTVTDLGEGPGGKPVELGDLTVRATGNVPKPPAESGVATRPAGTQPE